MKVKLYNKERRPMACNLRQTSLQSTAGREKRTVTYLSYNRSQSPKREPSVTDSQRCQAHKPHPTKSPEAGYHLGSCCFPLSLNYLLLLLLLGLLHQELGTLCLLLGCREKGHRHWKYIVSSIRTWQLRPGAPLPKEPVTFREHIEVQNIPGGTLLSLEKNPQHPDPPHVSPTVSDRVPVWRGTLVLGTQSLLRSIPLAKAFW